MIRVGDIVVWRDERYVVKAVHMNAAKITIEDDEGFAVTVDWADVTTPERDPVPA